MSDTREHVKALLLDIKHDTQRYDALRLLLQQQRDAMIGCNTDTIQQVNAALLPLYQQLAGSAQRRSDILQTLRLANDSQGMAQLLRYLPVSLAQQVESWWRTLENNARACQQLNERNGILLTMQQETLESLTGEPSRTFLYTR
ncbi:flagellar protein FlgN [Pantoea sp. Mb-10]|uniref:flagellar protein FlgN n=1 Tax=unclassified Pantoea TaxID=2630326 RepID=UPI001E3F45CC|nr:MULTISPECIES: flagellar protein FlgN [unclassified Pantoea]MCE0489874.1 flagellar protein FlgN [Pantoea sp. Mb-10]MCE0501020.1 flagellar protein FlgN [Pantoea sp. Pb-8]